MKIIIVITVVETLMLTLWLAYSYSRRRKSNLRIALGRPGPTFVHRAFARKSHQVMYKKWSKDRHEE
jgi:hypothetical protein